MTLFKGHSTINASSQVGAEVMNALSILILRLLNDKPSFLSFVTCLVVVRSRPQPFQGCINILKILKHSNLLGFVVVLSYLL